MSQPEASPSGDVADTEFYRPLGGGLEFGEHSDVGVRREFQEELGIDVVVKDRIAAFENVFEFRGQDCSRLISFPVCTNVVPPTVGTTQATRWSSSTR